MRESEKPRKGNLNQNEKLLNGAGGQATDRWVYASNWQYNTKRLFNKYHNMNIRKVVLEEIEDVLTLIDEYDRAKSPWPDEHEIASIYSSLIESGGCVIGAFENNKLVGTCTVNICPNFSWSGRPYAIIENVIVSEKFRNKGIGKAILVYSKEMAEKIGCYKVALMTGSKHESTLRFYEAAGFTANKVGFQSRFNA